jgi:hypothetical protein
MLRQEWYVEVDQAKIDTGFHNNAERCPIALSVNEFMYRINGQPVRYPDGNYVAVGYDSTTFHLAGDDVVIYSHMPSLRQWVIRFESDRSYVKPIVVGFLNEGNGSPFAYIKKELV